MCSIAVLTADRLGERMAGPALRATRIAERLEREDHDVVLVSTAGGRDRAARAAAEREVLVVQGPVTLQVPQVLASESVVVVDLYDPLHLEQLAQRAAGCRTGPADLAIRLLNDQLRRGDYFLCGHEAQRQLWLGHLAGVGRLTPATYDEDPTLRRLLEVVPFGIPEQPPVPSRGALRGGVPGIGADDLVIVWGGGIYDWLDPLTVIRAVGLLASSGLPVRLAFLGVRHPNSVVATMRVGEECRRLADQLGLTGTHVFFVDSWVTHAEHGARLLDADVGISAHHAHLEARFSIRARILDYLWAGLPVVTTDGDPLASLVRTEGLGITVAAGDVVATACALEALLTDEPYRQRVDASIRRVVPTLTWERALTPLVDFCARPRRAADAAIGVPRLPGPPHAARAAARSAVRSLTGRTLQRVRPGRAGRAAR